MMRKPTPEFIRERKLELSRLRIDWERMNRPHINKDLKNSLFTRILELDAEIQAMEQTLKGPRRTRATTSAAA